MDIHVPKMAGQNDDSNIDAFRLLDKLPSPLQPDVKVLKNAEKDYSVGLGKQRSTTDAELREVLEEVFEPTMLTNPDEDISQKLLDQILDDKEDEDLCVALRVDEQSGEDDFPNQSPCQSKPLAKQPLDLKPDDGLKDTREVFDDPLATESSDGITAQTATSVLKGKEKKVLVPGACTRSHETNLSSVKGGQSINESNVFTGFSLNEYLKTHFADHVGPINVSDLRNATENLGVMWEKVNGVWIPVHTEKSIFEENHVSNAGDVRNLAVAPMTPNVLTDNNTGSANFRTQSVESRSNILSVSMDTSVYPPPTYQGYQKALMFGTSKMQPSQTSLQYNLRPLSQNNLPIAIGNDMSPTAHNIPNPTAKGFEDTSQMLSKTEQNKLFATLAMRPDLFPQAEGNTLFPTDDLLNHETPMLQNNLSSPMSVYSDAPLLSMEMAPRPSFTNTTAQDGKRSRRKVKKNQNHVKHGCKQDTKNALGQKLRDKKRWEQDPDDPPSSPPIPCKIPKLEEFHEPFK